MPEDLEGTCDPRTLLILPGREETAWTGHHDSWTLVRTLKLYYHVPSSGSELPGTSDGYTW